MLTLALAVLLTFTDPPADLGNGSVRQPTAAVGRPNGALDVTQLELYDSETVGFSLTFTSLQNPFDLQNGFTFPVIEIYIDDQSNTGSTTLLPGSGMRLPRDATWKYAFKLTGDTLQVFEASANGWQDVSGRYPTTLSVEGTTITVKSSLPRPEKLDLYGVVGSYTGFNETGWTPISRNASPWAYSSPTQIPAALDVIAPTFEAQQNALATGVLPVIRPPRPLNPWLFVMIGGVLLALVGVLLRFSPSGDHAPAYKPAPPVKPRPAAQESKPKSAYVGPYKPEPLKSRSAALKTMVGDKPATPLPEEMVAEDVDSDLTPGQLMAAQRTKAMILNDRKARDESPIPEVQESAEPVLHLEADTYVNLDETKLDETKPDETEPDDSSSEEANSEESAPAASDNDVVSSTAIPLFQAPRIPTPPLQPEALSTPSQDVKSVPQPTIPKAQFASSEAWHDNEESFDFLWTKKTKPASDAKQLEPEKQTPENNS
jgi:hypothetical protein